MSKISRKLISLLLLMSIVFVLAGCGAKSKVPDEYNYDLSKYVKLGQYEGLEYSKADTSVTDAEIEESIQEDLELYASMQENPEGTAKAGDIVNIDYKGSVDGVEGENMSDEGHNLPLTENSGFIDGFADAIIGHKVGENFDIKVTFPDPYPNNTDLSGKEAVFNITINYIVPELSDDFVKEYYEDEEITTVAELKEHIREELSAEKAESSPEEETSDLFQQILENSEFPELPEEEIQKKKEKMISSYKDMAAEYGMEYSDLLSMYFGMTEEDFENEASDTAENQVKQELVLYALADALGIKITDKEYTKYLDELLEEAEMDRKEFEEEYGQTIEEWALDYDIYPSYLYETVMEKVKEMSVLKEN